MISKEIVSLPDFNLMRKLFFLSTPTSLIHFDEDTLMYVQADGNYVVLHFRDSSAKVLTMQLHEFEELLIRKAVSKFSKVGRSLIVNNQYVFSINTTKQEIVISDKVMFSHTLTASKGAVEDLKRNIENKEK